MDATRLSFSIGLWVICCCCSAAWLWRKTHDLDPGAWGIAALVVGYWAGILLASAFR